MGMDLKLYFLREKFEYYGTGIYLGDGLDFHRDYRLFGQIEGFDKGGHIAVNQAREGKTFLAYQDEGLREVKTDPYGSPLTYTTAGELSKLTPSDDTSKWNRAIIKFIKALPKETIVILWWH